MQIVIVNLPTQEVITTMHAMRYRRELTRLFYLREGYELNADNIYSLKDKESIVDSEHGTGMIGIVDNVLWINILE